MRRERLGYVPALDGVRALAITLVVLWHAFKWPLGGFLGVHVFFVLSGFLITSLLLQEWEAKGSVSLPSFYRRRALRLLPALAVLLATYATIQTTRAAVLDRAELDLWTSLKSVLYSAFYVSNLVQAFGINLPDSLTHLWSLATEEQFYLLWPFLLVAALRVGVPQRFLEAFLLVGIAAVAGNRMYLALTGATPERLYYAPDTSFDPILIGCLLGLWFVSGRVPRVLQRPDLLRPLALLAGLTMMAIVLVSSVQSRVFYWGLLLPFSVAAAIVLLFVVTDGRSGLARVLALPPLVFLGKVSYSLYLWHPLVLVVGAEVADVPKALGIGLSLVVASGSYFFVERPFLRRKARDRAEVDRRPPESGPIASPRGRRDALGTR